MTNNWNFPEDPRVGEMLSLRMRPHPQPREAPYACLFREEADGAQTAIVSIAGTRLSVSCACHGKLGEARYKMRWKREGGYPEWLVFVFADNTEITPKDVVAKHEGVHVTILELSKQ